MARYDYLSVFDGDADRDETPLESVFDYVHVRADGTEEGNTTYDILMRRRER